MSERPLQYCKFVVDEKPYCLWDWDLKKRTLLFLDGVDLNYFSYLIETHQSALEGEQAQYAALAIRTAYSQALETLFAFLGATLQAPLCVPAWLVKYTNSDLDSFITKINKMQPIYSSLGYGIVFWEDISNLIHMNLILEDKEQEKAVKRNFADLWARFANDFTNEKIAREYNSIKHGFRIRPGGFAFALGVQEQPDVPAPAENMRLLGKSQFGSSFVKPEAL